MSAERTLAEWASYYRFLGWSVFPILPKDKRPHFGLLKSTGFVNAEGNGSWKAFSEKLAPEELVEHWWKEDPSANIGLACGKVSGVTVVDIDFKPDEPSWIPADEVETKLRTVTRTAVTGSGGMHMFCAYSPEVPNQSDKRVHPQVDLRNDGGYVVLAPSVHPNGRHYAWKTSEAEDLAPVPEVILGKLRSDGMARKDGVRVRTGQNEWARIFDGVREKVDGRNYAATKVIGKLVHALNMEFIGDARLHEYVWDCCLAWNARNKPPMSEAEMRTIFQHVIKHPYGFGE